MSGSATEVPLSVQRERKGSIESELVRKGQTQIGTADEKIIGFYAPGLSEHNSQAYPEDLYGQRVSFDMISRVTGSLLDKVQG